jgi:GNAT superfamily N-acetyltransferase
MTGSAPIEIRLATAQDAPFLAGVEQSAGAAFRALPDLAWIADQPIAPGEASLPLIEAGTVWVAQDAQSGVIGELLAGIFGDALHIFELAVAKDFQQRGIGRRLIDVAVREARSRNLEAITLTTFRHVAWNGPFYAHYGFAELSGADVDARLAEIIRSEEARGLPDRCAMRLML